MRLVIFLAGFALAFGLFLQYFSFWATIGALYLISLSLIAGVAFLQRQSLQDDQDGGGLLHSEGHGGG